MIAVYTKDKAVMHVCMCVCLYTHTYTTQLLYIQHIRTYVFLLTHKINNSRRWIPPRKLCYVYIILIHTYIHTYMHLIAKYIYKCVCDAHIL